MRTFAGLAARAVAALAIATLALAAAQQPASATNYTPVTGSGSSWAGIAINQWISYEGHYGLQVNYNPDGSGTGRTEFIQNQDDFTGSDPPFRNGDDELAGTAAEHVPYSYSYIPDVAGGTAFMYHIEVGGHLITNLRLSGEILMDIFTGKITNWDDKRITQIYGAQLPNLPIVPVIRSDYSGATYFFTRWMAHMWPSQWNAFCQRVHQGIKLPCPQTELYPQFGNAKAENGSNNVAAYITSSFANGAIGYDEYAYALNSHYPVVKLLNPGGYFVLPTATNVSVALTKAVINENRRSPNFLQQNLDNVYTFKDPRSYPLASYSYFIVPRTPHPPPFFDSPSGKGQSFSRFITYMLCAGQSTKIVDDLGYASLPLNLVQGGFYQAEHIPHHGPVPNPNTVPHCPNPTFQSGHDILLTKAPYPSPCDKLGAPLNCTVKHGKAVPKGNKDSSPTAGPSPSASGSGTAAGASGTAAGGGTGGQVTGQVVNVAASQASAAVLGTITALAILAAVTMPPAVALWLRRRRGQANG